MEAPQSQQESAEGTYDIRRLETLSDGVFAIALTLLVFDVKMNPPFNSYQDYLDNLGDLGASTLYYLLTFVVIAGYWAQNRHTMRLLKRQDAPFTWLTFLFLAFITFFPVSLNILNNSHDVQHHQFSQGVIIYAIVLAGCGFSSAILWAYATGGQRLIDSNTPTTQLRLRGITLLVAPAYFCLSLLLLLLPQFGNPTNLFYSWIALPFVVAIARRVAAHALDHHDEENPA